MPLVSVVIPVFDTDKYLELCLLSLTRQSYSDFEVICVDDRSRDNSAGIVLTFAQRDPRIKLVRHKENRGAGGARNTGIAESIGEYLMFVDSDDFVESNAIEVLIEGTEGGRYDVVESGYNIVAADGRILARHVPSNRRVDDMRTLESCLLVTNPSFWNKIWRRTLFTSNGISFPERMYWEDLATVPRLIAASNSMRSIDFITYNYVDRPDSYTNAASGKHLIDYIYCFDILKNFLEGENLYKKESESFRELVRINMHYHAEKVLKNGLHSPAEVRKYIRHVYAICSGYLNSLELDDTEPEVILAQIRDMKREKGPPPAPNNQPWSSLVNRIVRWR